MKEIETLIQKLNCGTFSLYYARVKKQKGMADFNYLLGYLSGLVDVEFITYSKFKLIVEELANIEAVQ